MKTSKHILYLEDNLEDINSVKLLLENSGYHFKINGVQTLSEYEKYLFESDVDIILSDYKFKEFDGLSALKLAKEINHNIPFIFVSGTYGEQAVIDAFTNGADNYLLKNSLSGLVEIINQIFNKQKNENSLLKENIIQSDIINKYRGIVESIDMGISIIDREMHVIEINNCIQDWFPHVNPTEKPLCYQVFNETPYSHECSNCPAVKTLKDGKIYKTVRKIHHNGDIHYYRIISAPITDKSGEIVASLEMLEDISTLKKMEEALESSNRIFTTIIDAAPIAIFDLDLDGKVHSFWNKGAEKMFGWSSDEVIGKLLPTVPVEKLDEFQKNRDKIQQGMTLEGVDASREKSDGTPIDYKIYAAPLHSSAGDVNGTIAVLIDTTEQNRIKKESLENLNFFKSIDKVHRAIQGITDPEQLMKDFLDAVLSIFECDRAFLMYPCDPQSKTWSVPMERTKPEYPGALKLNLEMEMDDQVAKTLEILLESEGPVAFGPGTPYELPEEVSEQFGFKSFLSIAAFPRKGKAWQFGIHQCSYARNWTDADKRLFLEISRRLEAALNSMLISTELVDSEKRFRQVFENSPVSLWEEDFSQVKNYLDSLKNKGINDIEKYLNDYPEEVIKCTKMVRITDVNRAALKLHDAGNKQELLEGLERMFTTESFDAFKKELICIWNSETEIVFDSVVKSLSDERKFVSIYFAVSPGYEKNLSRVLVSLVDITERKRTESALKESEAKYIDLYENAPDMYLSIDARTGLIENCNETFVKNLGFSRKEIIGQPIFGFYHPDDREYAKDIFKEFLKKGKIYNSELRIQKKNGTSLNVNLNVSAVRDEHGKIIYSRSTLRDVTKLHQNRIVSETRLHLLNYSATHSLDELLEETVNKAEELTESSIGFYHFVDADQKNLTLQNWSTSTKAKFCKAEGKGLHYSIATAGVWVDCVKERKPIIHNDYKSLPHRKGLPEGHAEVIRELVVPIKRGNKIKAIIGIGNKLTDYTEQDIAVISLVADQAWEIAERKIAEEAFHRKNRELLALNNCNQTLLRADDERTLVNDICQIICSDAGYILTWVGYAHHDKAKTVQPVAWSGVEDGYLEKAKITWDDTELGQGPTGTAIRTGKSHAILDFRTQPEASPWRENALKRGYLSSLALPLKDEKNNTFGVLNIYSTQSGAFTPDEIHLLEEIAANLAFGVITLRTRKQRDLAEKNLREKQEQLLESQHIAHIGNWWHDIISGEIYWSDEFFKIVGIKKQKPSFDLAISLIHPDDITKLQSDMDSETTDEKEFQQEFRIIRPDGEIRWIHNRWVSICNKDGKEIKRIGTHQDITERKLAEQQQLALQSNLESLWNLAKLANENINVLYEYIIGQILKKTDSLHGFYGLMTPDEKILTNAIWSTDVMSACKIQDRSTEFLLKDAGIWGDVIRNRAPVIINDYSMDLPNKKGTPEGHVQLKRFMAVPVFSGDRIVAVGAVSNKAIDYDDEDLMAIDGFLTSAQIVIDRKLAEEEMNLSSQRLVLHRELSPLGFLEWDENFCAMEWNNSCETIFGYSREEAIGKHAKDLILHPEVHDLVDGIYESLMSQRGGTHSINENVTKDGRIIIIEWFNTTLIDENGEAFAVSSICRDITEQKKMENALITREREYRTLLENIPLFIVRFDTDLNRIYVNPAWEKASGLTSTDVPGVSYDKTPEVQKAGEDQYRAKLKRVLETGRLQTHLFNWINSKHEELFFELTLVPEFDNDNNVCGVLVVGHDLTERERMTKALEKRLIALTRPLDDPTGIEIGNLFNLEDIQELQDQFAQATGVASIITQLNGEPITNPSNFCQLCNDIIRKTEKGLFDCFKSDANLSDQGQEAPVIQLCNGAGLWYTGARIKVGGKHIANWLVGQVRDETQTEEKMRLYAREIGADENQFISAFENVPVMSQENFNRIGITLKTLAEQLSTIAFQNIQQARFITEQKQSERKFRALFEKSPIGISYQQIIYNEGEHPIDFKFLDVNENYVNLLGINPKGQLITDAIPDILDDNVDWIDFYKRISLDGETIRFQYFLEAQQRWFDIIGFQISHGRSVQAFIEITQQKLSESALRENEEKFRSVIEQSNDAIYILYHNKFELINKQFEELTGVYASEVMSEGFDLMTTLSPASQEKIKERHRLLALGKVLPNVYEFEIIHRNGTRHQVQASVSQIKYKNDVATLGILRDISDQKILEQQLLQAQKIESIGHLAGGVAHDFNNLLTPILGNSELALMNIKPSDPIYEDIKQISDTATKAKDLTRQLLAFSRKQVLEVKTVDINKLLENFRKILRRTIREDIKIDFKYNYNVHPIQVDISQIEQIIMNLAINAQDAMPYGGTISIETDEAELDENYASMHPGTEPGLYTIMMVSDTGMGMDEKTSLKVFEPFFTTKEVGKGTGLGLSTVYGIVKQHSGNIWIYSEPEKGTTFKIYFPAAEDRKETNTEVSDDLEKYYGNESILIVEDDDAVRKVAQRFLKTYGYIVHVAENGNRALSFISDEKPVIDLLITDVIMPDLNGRQVHGLLSGIYPAIKTLYISGYSKDVISHHGILDEGINFIQKPLDLKTFIPKVREILDS